MKVLSIISLIYASEKPAISSLLNQWKLVQTKLKSGKFTPEVVPVLEKMLGMIVDDIVPKVLSAHDFDQKFLDNAEASVVACEDNKESHNKEFDTHTEDAALKLTKYNDCAGDRTAAEELLAECKDDLQDLKDAQKIACDSMTASEYDEKDYLYCSVECDYAIETGSDCFTKAEDGIKNLQGYFNQQKYHYDQLVEKCTDLGDQISDKETECNGINLDDIVNMHNCLNLLSDYHAADCKAYIHANEKCYIYEKCRMFADKAILKAILDMKKNEVDRKNEWTAVQQIKCAIDTLVADGKFEQEHLTTCMSTDIDTTHLNLVYPGDQAIQHDCGIVAKPHYCPDAGYKKMAHKDFMDDGEVSSDSMSTKIFEGPVYPMYSVKFHGYPTELQAGRTYPIIHFFSGDKDNYVPFLEYEISDNGLKRFIIYSKGKDGEYMSRYVATDFTVGKWNLFEIRMTSTRVSLLVNGEGVEVPHTLANLPEFTENLQGYLGRFNAPDGTPVNHWKFKHFQYEGYSLDWDVNYNFDQ